MEKGSDLSEYLASHLLYLILLNELREERTDLGRFVSEQK